MKGLKARLLRVDTLALAVAALSLGFTVFQHFRIQEFDRMLKCPILAFDVMVNRYKDVFSVSLMNKGQAPGSIIESKVNGICHSAVSVNEIRQSIFDALKPVLREGCTARDIRYAGYDAGSTIGVGEKSVVFSILKGNVRIDPDLKDVDSESVFRHFDKNTISIRYADLCGDEKDELVYP